MQENKTPHIVVVIIILFVLVVVIGYFFFFRDGVFVDDSKTLLAPPVSGQEADYESMVKRSARSSDTLTIGIGCQIDPLVIRLKAGDTLTIKNDDSVPHVIAFENNNFFSVSPHRSRDINITEKFSKSAGIYRYRCSDQSDENVGVMYITDN